MLVGQSMGAVSSIKAAANYSGKLKIKGIAAHAAYATIKPAFHNVGQNKLKIFDLQNDLGTYLGGLTGGVDYDSFDIRGDVEKLNQEDIPIIYGWGGKDDILPKSVIDPLIKLAKPTDVVKIYKNSEHTDFTSPERINDVVSFVSGHMGQ